MSDVSVWPALPDQVRHAWDQLAAACGDLHLSSAWLDYQSSTLRLPVRYGTACADGLAAALPIFELPDRPARRLYDPCVVFEASPHRPRPEARRYLLGSPAGYSNDIMLRGDLRPAVRRQVLRELVTALRAEAREDGREHELYMLYTTGRCKEILDDAGLLDNAVPTLPNYHLSLPGNSFQDYLDAFKHKRRNQIKGEIRKFTAAGYTTDVCPLAQMVSAAVPLIVQLEARHGNRVDPERTRESLVRLAAAFKESAICFCLRRGRHITGVAVVIENGRTLDGRTAGFDYPHLMDAYEYFNLTLYSLIRYAYQRAARCLVLAPTAGHAKVLRGATEIPSYGLRVRIPPAV